jgi:presqualene diphosphate synthase
MQLLPVQRREAMYALYAFWREVGDIADGKASRSLKQALLLNWRSEIAHLFAGRPRHDVTRGLSEAIHLFKRMISRTWRIATLSAGIQPLPCNSHGSGP